MKMNMKKVILNGLLVFLLVGFLSFFSCGPKTETIIIFHMNDVHARIDDFGKIAWLVRQEREKHPDVFLVNAGDNFSGNPVVDQYVPKGEPMLRLLNQLKVDVLTLGNHDFDYGQEILKNAMEKANYPMLCANVEVAAAQGGIIPQPTPYTILETQKGTKLAVLGLIQVSGDTGIPATHPDRIKGLTFSDGIETAKEYRFLKNESDVFIGLTHLGYDRDEWLAREMGELDIIIGGHSHTAIKDPKEINGVLVTQAGGNAKYLGRIELTVENGNVTRKKGELIEVKSIPHEVPEIKAMIREFNDNPELKRVIATLSKAPAGADPLGNLITDAVRNIHHLDIAFHNAGGIRLSRLEKEVRLQDVYKLLPFGNDVVQLQMTAAEIKTLIKNACRKRKNDLKVSGIQYVVLIKQAGGSRREVTGVELSDETGAFLDESKTYKVGFNSYIASSYKFTHQDPGRALQTTIAQTLIDYLRQGGDVCKDIEKMRTHEKEVNQ